MLDTLIIQGRELFCALEQHNARTSKLRPTSVENTMNRFTFAIMLLFSAAPLSAQSLPSIDWSKAGKGDAPKTQGQPLQPQPEAKALPDSGFACGTVTRLSMEQDRLLPDSGNGLPKQVQRCSRDGLSFEVTPPQP
ncbi:hypothetical protein [Rhizobium sp. FY34]|uniref:hypothetical protein n=1 Tax=Rhizobium sp. FY34 TaxID=2562309 RepID=UPI0010C1449F|nr:hypothetical protein [Rhizobium sp. FY34]